MTDRLGVIELELEPSAGGRGIAVDLDERCASCHTTGHDVVSRRCGECNGVGYVPTPAGASILGLIARHFGGRS